MADDRGTYGTVKTFGGGLLAGVLIAGVGGLVIASYAQRRHVEEINAYRGRKR